MLTVRQKPKRHRKTKSKHRKWNDIFKSAREKSPPNDFISVIARAVTKHTHGRVHKLKVDLEPSRVVLTGVCDSFYVKQLAQQAVKHIVIDMELVNDIAVHLKGGFVPPSGPQRLPLVFV